MNESAPLHFGKVPDIAAFALKIKQPVVMLTPLKKNNSPGGF